MKITHLFAGKPQPFGPKGSPSSIVKNPYQDLNITREGAIQDEQGNKKLHGGPYMALHQYAQSSYDYLAKQFPKTEVDFAIGSIGENISAPDMHDSNVFIGDQYKIGGCILQVVSPRAPCSKINHRYKLAKLDQFIAQHGITGWYFSVLDTGTIKVGDDIELHQRESNPISVKQIWQIRELNKAKLSEISKDELDQWLALADSALNTASLSPEWQAYINRVAVKLAKVR